jgi:hypothetical protein
MEREIEAGVMGNSSRDSVMARRKLQPMVKRRPMSPAVVVAGQDAATVKTSADKWEALISVWWDQPPAEDL